MWVGPSATSGSAIGVIRRAAVLVSVALAAAACNSSVSIDGAATPLATDANGVAVLPTTAVTTSSEFPEAIDSVDTTITAPPTTQAVVPSPLTWESVGDGLEQAWLEVPIDYSASAGPTMDLYVLRHLAPDPDVVIGTLLVNPGGPGYPGSEMARAADRYLDPELLKYFNIVGWDPRGSGQSEFAIDCTDDYDYFFTELDSTPESDADRQQIIDRASKFAEDCRTANPEVLQFVGTNNSARDMNQLRLALGEDQVSYFGFSYGSELGAVWATLFPDTVRAAVLDGASDPTVSMVDANVQQSSGFQATLNSFFNWCVETGCAFVAAGEDPAQVFAQLSEQLDDAPIPSEEGRPPVNRDVLVGAVVEAMYSDRYWNALSRSLADARNGNGAGLLALYDKYYQRRPSGDYANSLEAFFVISCMDEPNRETVEEADATAERFHGAAPLLFPEGALPGYVCGFYPESLDPRIEVTGAGAGPIVVIGTTGDPATPLASSRKMAETLEDGIFITVSANKHTGYGVNRCVVDAVNNYLIDLTLPEDGMLCE